MWRRVLLAFVAAAALVAAEDKAPFNKDELEALLRKEHSQKVSNIYDSENGIQCAAPFCSRQPRAHIKC